jgi:F-type H+-transporting ATPase subunit delta
VVATRVPATREQPAMTNKTAATRYARAIFDVAIKEQGDLPNIERQLGEFVELFAAHPTLAKVLLNPAVPVQRKRAAIVELTQQLAVTPVLAKLLMLLAERDRLVLLPDVLTTFRERLMDHQHVVRAEVTTAAPLEAGQAEAIEQRLAQVTGRTVKIVTRVDEGIIGGLVARIGGTVFDGSVTRQLEKIKERLA